MQAGQPSQENLDSSNYCAPGLVENQVSLLCPGTCPHSLAVPVPGAVALHGPSKLCCRQDPPLAAKTPPAGPELRRPGFLFSPYVCEQASPGACGHGGGVNESVNTAILIKGCAE